MQGTVKSWRAGKPIKRALLVQADPMLNEQHSAAFGSNSDQGVLSA